MLDPTTTQTPRAFRAAVDARFGARRHALVELLDATTTAGLGPSLVPWSLAAVHRRGWGSLDDALSSGTLDAAALRALLLRHPVDAGPPIYALATRGWPRSDAETSPERGHSLSPSRQSAGQPIVTGWLDAWLAPLTFTHQSGTAPRDGRRVPPSGDAHPVAAAPIREVVAHQPAERPVPLCVVAAGYDPETLARALGDLDVAGRHRGAVLVRLGSGRCLDADLPPLDPGQRPLGRRSGPAPRYPALNKAA